METELIEDSISIETRTKINQARIVNGRAYEDRFVPYKNFAELFQAKAKDRENETYLIYRNYFSNGIKSQVLGGEEKQEPAFERLEFTYGEIYHQAWLVAKYLRDDLGIKPGDRISTFSYNHYRTVIVYYAALMVGAVLVPINIGEDDDRVEFAQANSDTKVVFVMPCLIERYENIRPKLTNVNNFIHFGSSLIESDIENQTGCDLESLECSSALQSYIDLDQVLSQKLQSSQALEDQSFCELDVDLDTEALIVYTSGTTGNPKGVLLQQYQILVDAHCITGFYGLNEQDRMMLVLPIHHVNGLIVTLMGSLYIGGSVVLNRKFSASRYWQIAQEEGACMGSVVPTILNFLCEAASKASPLQLPNSTNIEYLNSSGENKQGQSEPCKLELKQPSNSALKNFFLICGAGPLTVELAMRFEKTFGIQIIHGYGLSETTAYSCYIPLDMNDKEHEEWLSSYGYPSIGIALPCNEMAIHDEDGNELAENEKGEIVIRGHNVMKYYFKRPETNEETFKNGWFRSGDEGFFKVDSQGRKQFFITGRLKELIIRGGINYSPFEIDEILNEIPGIKAAMSVGFENSAYGEEVGAYVVLEEGASVAEQDIVDFCKKELSYNKAPKVVVFGKDFPVTSTGKYQRNKLKPLFAEYRNTQF